MTTQEADLEFSKKKIALFGKTTVPVTFPNTKFLPVSMLIPEIKYLFLEKKH